METTAKDKEGQVSLANLHKRLTGLLELNNTMLAVIKDKSLSLQAYKKLLKKVQEETNMAHEAITNAVRSGSKETVQYTLDDFKTLQTLADDLAYELFQNDTDQSQLMRAAIEDLNLTYEPSTQSIYVKGMVDDK